MKQRIILVASMLVLIAIAYGVGHFKASYDISVSQMNSDFEHWQSLAKLDRSFLTNIVTRPSTLTSGAYVMETTFPGKAPTNYVLDLVFSNGQFALPKPTNPKRAGMADTLVQRGNVVSWAYEGVMYEADAECVGLIDGNVIWGRIYGWNSGDESIGLWRIYPKPNEQQK
jgi:hypothetical protein